MATSDQGGKQGAKSDKKDDKQASKQEGSGTRNRGFASMDPERQREIASEGGKAAHQKGTAHEFTSEEARRAGSMSHGNRQSDTASSASSRSKQGSAQGGKGGNEQSAKGGSHSGREGGRDSGSSPGNKSGSSGGSDKSR
jgi:hypothetical protein